MCPRKLNILKNIWEATSNRHLRVNTIINELKASMQNIAVFSAVFFENIEAFYLSIINKAKDSLDAYDINKLRSFNHAV